MANTVYQTIGQRDDIIMVVNCGSSSIKVSFFTHKQGECHRAVDAHLSGRTGSYPELHIHTARGSDCVGIRKDCGIGEALDFILKEVQQHDIVLTSIRGIGHRVVHGGTWYINATVINESVIRNIKGLRELAPLHNQICLEGIEWSLEYFGKDIPEIAVFDTAFHSKMPSVAAQYALPGSLVDKHAIKRYGFHGIAHANVWQTYAKQYDGMTEARVITMHLGNGCSLAAIRGGRCVDTSMGFTPAEGLVMATRAGDIDAAIMEYLCIHEDKNPTEILRILNTESGLLGVSGISSDMKHLETVATTDDKARFAIDLFCYRIRKYLGAYLAVLGGADAFIFSGGIGEHSPLIRWHIIDSMQWYGLGMDSEANSRCRGLAPSALKVISAPTSSVSVLVAGADENAYIAQETVTAVLTARR